MVLDVNIFLVKVILPLFVAIFRQCRDIHGDRMQQEYAWVRPFQPEENTTKSVPVEKEYLRPR